MKSFIIAFVIGFAAWNVFTESEWDVMSVTDVASPYSDGTACSAATHRNGVVQTMCFDEIDTWYGTGSDPVYFVENGVTRLF